MNTHSHSDCRRNETELWIGRPCADHVCTTGHMSCAPVKWQVVCSLSLRLLGSGGTHAGVSFEVALPAPLFLLLAVLVLGCWSKASWHSPVPHNGWCCLVCDDIHVIEDGMLEPSAVPSVGIAA